MERGEDDSARLDQTRPFVRAARAVADRRLISDMGAPVRRSGGVRRWEQIYERDLFHPTLGKFVSERR